LRDHYSTIRAGRGEFLEIFTHFVFRLRGIMSPSHFACLLIFARFGTRTSCTNQF
jgi:hypothetical protein